MTITYVNSSYADLSAGGPVAPPAGVALGDILLAFVTGYISSAPAASGWRPVAKPPVELGLDYTNATTTVLTRTVAASEPSSYTFTTPGSAGRPASVEIAAYRTASGVDVAAAAGWTDGLVAPSLGPIQADDVLVCAWAVVGNNVANDTTAITPPSGFTLRSSRLPVGYGSGGIVADKQLTGTPTTGTQTATCAASPDDSYKCAAAVALYVWGPPNAPALTGPASSATVNEAATQRFAWTFSTPSVGDSQSGFDLRYSKDSGTTWTVVSGSTPNGYVDIPAGTFTPGSYEWQVRTYESLGKVGDWSTSSFFTAAVPPAGPAITYPISGQTVQQIDSVSWSFAAQQGYQVRRVADDGSGGADTSTVYFDTGQIINAATRTVALAFPTNSRTEHVQVSVLGSGLWSPFSDVTVHVSYTPPPTPDVLLTADDDTASLTASWTTAAPSGDGPAATNVDIYLNDGTTDNGIVVALAQPITGSWTYWVPASGIDYSVQIVANADNGTSSPSGWIFGDEGAAELIVTLLPDGRTMRLSGTAVTVDGDTLTVTADPPELTFPDADTMHVESS